MTRAPIHPSHVALLVRSVDRAAGVLREFGYQIGDAEEWDGEGTKEIYVGKEKSNSLLLMEPIKPGAYQRAMEKRGPGLHHLAIDVLNLEEFLLSLSSVGWLIHPMSIRTIQKSKTAYLARPGFPALVEVQERPELRSEPLFVDGVGLQISEELSRLGCAVGLDTIIRADDVPSIYCEGRKIQIHTLCSGELA